MVDTYVDLVRNHKTAYSCLEFCKLMDSNPRLKEEGQYFRSNVEPQTQQRLFISAVLDKRPHNLDKLSENYLVFK